PACAGGRVGRARVGEGEGLADQSADATEVQQRDVRVEARDRYVGGGREAFVRGSHDARHALQASGRRREARLWRGELAGEQREQAVAEAVDPDDRVPRVLREIGRTALGVEAEEQPVAVDRVVRGQLVVPEAFEAPAPAGI